MTWIITSDQVNPPGDAAITYGITNAGGVFNLRSTGTVDYEIEWGDGNVEISTVNVLPHTYTAGNYTLAVYSDGVYRPYFDNVTADVSQITSVTIGPGANLGTNLLAAWEGVVNMTSFVCPFSVTTGVTNFTETWARCGFTNFPLIDTSSGTSFAAAFYLCSNLTSFAPIDTSSCDNFDYGWFGCSSLTSFPLIDTSSGTNFTRAWDGCSNLNNIGVAPGATTSLPLFDFSSATTLSNCFKDCSSITTVPVFDVSNATDVGAMFYGCTNLNNFPGITLRTTANVSLENFFAFCTSLTNFTLFDTSTVTDMSAMFYFCTGLTSFPALFDTSAAVNLANTWTDCQNLTSFPVLNTANATTFRNAWARNYGLTDFPLLDTTSITTCQASWYQCTNLANFPANMFDTTGTLVASAFNIAWFGCALTAQSIENILVSLDTNGASNITLGIDGGTNAGKTTWSTAAVTAYDNLIVKGWTISFNA